MSDEAAPTEPQTFDWQMDGGNDKSWGGKARSWIHDTPGRTRALSACKTLAVWITPESEASSAESEGLTPASPRQAGSTPSCASPTRGGETCSGPGSPGCRCTTTYAQSLSENQRGELLLTDVAHQLTAGGGKPGQGYQAVLISSVEGSHVSRSASPESEAARETSDSSGPSSSASSPSSGPAGSSSKTCRDSRPTSPTTSRTTDVYAAGLIDGEGCMYVDRSLIPCLDVGMAESAMPLLAKLRSTYGGTLKKFRPATDEWQAGWTWRLSGTPCAETLKLLMPHMRLKGRQARLILDLQELKDSTMLPGGSRTRWTPETRARAEEIRAEVKALNRRGPDAEWDWPDGADAVLVGDTWLSPQRDLLSETGYGEFSGTFPTSGLAWATGSLTAFSTAVTSECRSDADGCSSSEPSLTEILEPPPTVPERFLLSARAALGILRRAEKRGRTLPSHLSVALATVARTTTTDRQDG